MTSLEQNGPHSFNADKDAFPAGIVTSPVDTIIDYNLEECGDGVDEAYAAKSHLINQCLQREIGFGRYQWELFILTGFGWLADNLWLQGVAIILPQVQADLDPPRVEYVTLSLYAGLIAGATVFGTLADVIGRKPSWQITLFLTGVFGIATGGASNFVALCSLVACVGFSVGGNLPIDGALFLEHIPQSHQWLLTFLSAFWSVGQLVASLIVWVFVANFPPDKGWRYSLYTMGCLTLAMFFCRYVIFELQESSKFLVAAGRDDEAIQVLQYMAKRNAKTISLTTEKLAGASQTVTNDAPRTSIIASLKRSCSFWFSLPLFSTKRLGVNSSLIILIWGIIGLAYPLYNGFLPLYLANRLQASNSTSQTYRDYSITSICGVPGSVIACILVDWMRNSGGLAIGGRRMTLAISTLLTGVFLFLFTTAKDEASDLGFSCAAAFTQNAMYGVLYAYTPEAFPAPHRGTGDALCSAFNRITGLLAPVIKITTTSRDGGSSSIGANAPVFVSASLFIVAAFLTMLLPIETAGKAAL